MDKIVDIHARMILDSRGNPTIETDVSTDDFIGSAAVPSGASTGKHEALELRDGLKAYKGKGVNKAIRNVNTEIRDKLLDLSVLDQHNIDKAMLSLDGTKNKKRVGANAILSVSMASARVASGILEIPLFDHIAGLAKKNKLVMPIPMANVINGGVHAGNDLQVQEFMICPVNARSFSEAVRIVSETYHTLKGIIEKKYGKDAVNVGDEGGFAPPVKNAEQALKLLEQAITKAGYKSKIRIALDAAASEFYKNGRYEIEKGRRLDRREMVRYWIKLVDKHPLIFSLEDPFAEDDFESWKELMQALKKRKSKLIIVGDDITVTNPERINLCIKEQLCNCLLLKVNQIGTLTEAIESAKLAENAGWNIIVSHRSGETEDPFIADLTVGISCGYIKLGAPCRGERTAKYNQLLRIEEMFGKKERYGIKN